MKKSGSRTFEYIKICGKKLSRLWSDMKHHQQQRKSENNNNTSSSIHSIRKIVVYDICLQNAHSFKVIKSFLRIIATLFSLDLSSVSAIEINSTHTSVIDFPHLIIRMSCLTQLDLSNLGGGGGSLTPDSGSNLLEQLHSILSSAEADSSLCLDTLALRNWWNVPTQSWLLYLPQIVNILCPRLSVLDVASCEGITDDVLYDSIMFDEGKIENPFRSRVRSLDLSYCKNIVGDSFTRIQMTTPLVSCSSLNNSTASDRCLLPELISISFHSCHLVRECIVVKSLLNISPKLLQTHIDTTYCALVK
eukprot:PhM_4_TR10497/c0_g2_i1/m.88626